MSQDSIDDLLTRAFAPTVQPAANAGELTRRTMARIQRRERLRGAVLGGASVIAAGIAATGLLDVLPLLQTALPSDLTTELPVSASGVAIVLLGVSAPWLLWALDDAG